MEKEFNLLCKEFEKILISLDFFLIEKFLSEHNLYANKKELEILIINVLETIGDKWINGDVSLSQVYMSGVYAEKIIDELFDDQNDQNEVDLGIGIVVFEDYHALGKKMINMELKIAGYKYIDLGTGLNIIEVLKKVKDNNIKILLVSTLMLPSALRVKELRKALDDNVKIVVGGAPFRIDQNLWKKVGANAFGNKASDVLKIIEEVK